MNIRMTLSLALACVLTVARSSYAQHGNAGDDADFSPPALELVGRRVDAAYAKEVAEKLGHGGTVVREREAFRVSSATGTTIVFTASGGFEFFSGKLAGDEYVTKTKQGEVVEWFTQYLRERGLLPAEARFRSIRFIAENEQKERAGRGYWAIGFDFRVSVPSSDSGTRPATLREIPVRGAALEAFVGNNEVLRLHWNWREIKRSRAVRRISTAQRQRIAQIMHPKGDAKRSHEPPTPATRETFYAMKPINGAQRILTAYYEDGSSHGESSGHSHDLMPETDDVPAIITASIAATTNAAEMSLTASVALGAGKRQVTWVVENADGSEKVVGRQPSIRLSRPTKARSIVLRASDDDGNLIERRFLLRRRPSEVRTALQARIKPGAVDKSRRKKLPPRASTPEFYLGHNWSMKAQTSASEGLRLIDVWFGGHSIAQEMSLPFLRIRTNKMATRTCRLTEQAGDPPCDAGLYTDEQGSVACYNGIGKGCQVDNEVFPGRFWLRSDYTLFDLSDSPLDGCSLFVTQAYVFDANSNFCAPADIATCARYQPIVFYRFFDFSTGEDCADDRVRSFEVNQRLDLLSDPLSANKGGDLASLIRDPDLGGAPVQVINSFAEPIQKETGPVVMASYGLKGDRDNYHQKDARSGRVIIPGCDFPSSFKCHHVHWRWFKPIFDSPEYGNGAVLVPKSQLVEAFVLLKRSSERTPANWDVRSFANNESIAPSSGKGKDLVFWLRTTSKPAASRTCAYGAAQNGISDVINYDVDWFVR